MSMREPIFTRSGRVVIISLAMTFAIMATVRTLGFESSVLGTLGVLFATHVINGIAQVIIAWQEGQEAYSAELERLRLWRLSQPSPFDSSDHFEFPASPAPQEVHPLSR